MNLKDPYAVKQLVDAAGQLHASRLYERFSDHDCFLVRMPKLDDPALAVLMGYGGETFGLNLFLGPDAVESYRVLFESGGAPSRRALQQMRMVGYQMSSAYDLTHDAKRWLKKAKAKPAGGKLYPDPMSLEPGKVPRVMLKDDETKLLLSAARGILKATEDKAFAPNGIAPDGRVLCLALNGPYDLPEVSIGWHAVAQTDQLAKPPASATSQSDPATARFDLSGLSRSGDNWLVTLMPAPGHIEGDERQPYMLVVCSEQSLSLYPTLLMQTEPEDVVQALAALMRGDASGEGQEPVGMADVLTPPSPGLPDRLILDGAALLDAVAQSFEPLGIQCMDGSKGPGMKRMLDDLEEAFEEIFDQTNDDSDWPSPEEAATTPDAGDLQGWKRVDGWLKDMVYAGFENDERFWGARALTRYFGRNADPERLLSKYRQQMIVDSYALWFTFDYRSARNRPTLAEQWLDDPSVPDVIKPLITAIQAQSPGLYRVEEIDEEAGKITLADLFTGGIEIATDFALSTCVEPGWVLAGRLVPVGDFRFFYAGGPLATAADITEMLDYLRPAHNTPSPDFFREQPHRLGHLWDVLDLHRSQQRNLFNSDGDELLFHEATLECRNRNALERELANLPGWEPDGDSPDDWVWLRPGHRVPDVENPDAKMFETHTQGPGGTATVLAQLEVHDEHLTLHTNSRERLDRACADLTAARGVKLQSIQTHAPGDPTSADHDDVSDEPIELEPEDIEAMRDYLSRYYRQWLDQPIPALDDQTPRQAATQPGLRSQLAAMIRAMPDPADLGTTGITLNAPRQMLLSELGLDDESSH